MFLGHFAVGFAAKRAAPKASLGMLILGAMFLDVLWPFFLLLGIEQVRVDPGNTAVTPLDFVSYPWSHSLAMALVWAALLGWIYRARTGYAVGALWLGICVVSHWVLDWISHRPDMPLYPGGGPKLGLGLWNSALATTCAESLLFAAGIGIYVMTTKARDRIGTIALYALAIFLAALYALSRSSPPPPSVTAIAVTDIALFLIFLWAAWIDRHRAVRA
jgi:hypothetical protein